MLPMLQPGADLVRDKDVGEGWNATLLAASRAGDLTAYFSLWTDKNALNDNQMFSRNHIHFSAHGLRALAMNVFFLLHYFSFL